MRPRSTMLLVLLPMLGIPGCGGTRILHAPPCTDWGREHPDVVRVQFSESASFGTRVVSEVWCHYGEPGGAFASAAMTRTSAPGVEEYAVSVPGVAEGRVHYFITFTDRNGDTKRVPAEGFYSCPKRE